MSGTEQSMKRFEDHKFLTGAGSFVDDMQLPDMLHAYVIRSPHPHALIRKVDAAAARRLPGVTEVVTGEDLTGVLGEIPASTAWPDDSVLAYNSPAHPVLATGRVCYVGEPVVVVVAETLESARDAADLVAVEYEPLPPILDPVDALKDGTEPLHQELGTNLAMHVMQGGGDLEGAFAKADKVVKQHFQIQRLAPAPLETRGVVALYQSRELRWTRKTGQVAK